MFKYFGKDASDAYKRMGLAYTWSQFKACLNTIQELSKRTSKRTYYYSVQPHLPSMIVSELDGVSDFCVVSTKNTKITAFLDFKI